jgi:hypothetical protein
VMRTQYRDLVAEKLLELLYRGIELAHRTLPRGQVTACGKGLTMRWASACVVPGTIFFDTVLRVIGWSWPRMRTWSSNN